jgi:hypothetical protein
MAAFSEADGAAITFLFLADLESLRPLEDDFTANDDAGDGRSADCPSSCSHMTTIKRRTPHLTLALLLAMPSKSKGASTP